MKGQSIVLKLWYSFTNAEFSFQSWSWQQPLCSVFQEAGRAKGGEWLVPSFCPPSNSRTTVCCYKALQNGIMANVLVRPLWILWGNVIYALQLLATGTGLQFYIVRPLFLSTSGYTETQRGVCNYCVCYMCRLFRCFRRGHIVYGIWTLQSCTWQELCLNNN